MTRLAGALGVTRQTAYTWVYQLDLAGVVGIRTQEQQQEDAVKAEEESPRPRGGGRAPGPDRVAVSARLDPRVWRALRIRAIEEDRTTSELLEDAVKRYLGATS